MTDSDLKEQRLRRTLKAVAERAPVGPGDETFWTRIPAPPAHQPRRLLVGVVAAVIIIAGIAAVIAYGPRSSDVGTANSGNNAASSPHVSTAWVVATPTGYVALKSESPHALGVQTLKSAELEFRTSGLRQAGWLSGIAAAWAPKALIKSGHTYSINLEIYLAIDQFGSTREAAAYQAKAASRYVGTRMKLSGVPGAIVIGGTEPKDPLNPGLTYTTVLFHRGPYVVTLGGGETNASGRVEHLVERTAQRQFRRLPH